MNINTIQPGDFGGDETGQTVDALLTQTSDLRAALTELVRAQEAFAASKAGQRLIPMQNRDRAMHIARETLKHYAAGGKA